MITVDGKHKSLFLGDNPIATVPFDAPDAEAWEKARASFAWGMKSVKTRVLSIHNYPFSYCCNHMNHIAQQIIVRFIPGARKNQFTMYFGPVRAKIRVNSDATLSMESGKFIDMMNSGHEEFEFRIFQGQQHPPNVKWSIEILHDALFEQLDIEDHERGKPDDKKRGHALFMWDEFVGMLSDSLNEFFRDKFRRGLDEDIAKLGRKKRKFDEVFKDPAPFDRFLFSNVKRARHESKKQ